MAELGLQVELPGLTDCPSPTEVLTQQATVRLPAFLMDSARARASLKGMGLGRWMASLVQNHLSRQPVATDKEIIAVRAMNRELAAIGRNVNQIAKALNSAVHGVERGQVSLTELERLPAAITVSRKVISVLVRKSQQSWFATDEE